MSIIVSDKLRIFFAIEGERGPFLLLHHGLFGSHRDWYEWGFVKALSRDYRLIMPDARGHGRSDKPLSPEHYTLAAFAGDVVALLDSLEIRNIIFFGYSLGALVGFELLTRSAGRMRGSVLGGEAPIVTEAGVEAWRTMEAELKEGFLSEVVRSLGERNLLACSDPSFPEDAINESGPVLLRAMQDWTVNNAESITVRPPLSLFTGAEDAAAERIQRVQKTISRAGLISLPGTTTAQAMVDNELLLKESLAFFQSSRQGGERDSAPAARRRGAEQAEEAPPSGEEEHPTGEVEAGADEEQTGGMEAPQAAEAEEELAGPEEDGPPVGTDDDAAEDGNAPDNETAEAEEKADSGGRSAGEPSEVDDPEVDGHAAGEDTDKG